MYPSGTWEGFWVQEMYGRQPMEAFTLRFAGGEVSGSGMDVIAPFTFRGSYDEQTGVLLMVKQYRGRRRARHRVTYRGKSDGEGSIQGTWQIGDHYTGPFLIRPVLARLRGDEPIQEIR